jgi:hypothetical protein
VPVAVGAVQEEVKRERPNVILERPARGRFVRRRRGQLRLRKLHAVPAAVPAALPALGEDDFVHPPRASGNDTLLELPLPGHGGSRRRSCATGY